MPTRAEIEIAQETLLDDDAPVGSIMPSEDLDVRNMTLDYIDQEIEALNTSKASVTSVNDALALKAPLASPAFTGTPTVPTATLGDVSLKVVNTTFLNDKINQIPIPLEWVAQVSQTGTAAPIPQSSAINTIEGGSFGDPQYKELVWARTGVGTFTVKLYYTGGNLDVSKVAIDVPSECRVTGKNDGSDGGGAFRMYTFKSYDLTGTAADGVLAGNIGGYFAIKIYP